MPRQTFKAKAEKIAGELKERFSDDTPRGKERRLAALSYLFILCFVPLASSKSDFVQFHAKQGFVMFILEVFAFLIIWFPIFGQLFMLILIFTAAVGFIKALNGVRWEIPFVHEWSKKVSFK